ncbi:hypothetical protein NAC44_12100 [Allorhizobium sp. BGMRC 0089]|uniref:hypothetical protein n=1 Tax=Allorhizobium sonneratiae TaxID=2934936 RepID=UPI0020343856|nr:hypothetical protein [Allorhizobium sonneratiae]MCM2293064.1 hypothetical protein [Allorhizobium sonneratiae]
MFDRSGLMIILISWALSLAPAVSASAQQVMDGSDKGMPPETWNAAREAILEKLRDPYSAQFDHMKVLSEKPPIICGRFNAKNASGGYEGFRPFQYDAAEKKLTLNETNECGQSVVDPAEIERIKAECEENTHQMKLYNSGYSNEISFNILMAKGRWCQNWYKQQILIELQKLDQK